MRTGRIAALACAALVGTSLTGCGPESAGFAAVVVVGEEVVVFLVACDTAIVSASIYEELGTYDDVASFGGTVPQGEVAVWRTGLSVADVPAHAGLGVNSESDDVGKAIIGTAFTRAQLRALDRDEFIAGFERTGTFQTQWCEFLD